MGRRFVMRNFICGRPGRLYTRRELEPALRSYSKALEIDPGSVDAWNGQIKCLINLDELHEADMWAKKAAEIVGESQDLLALRARICCRRGDFDRAFGLSDSAMQAPGNSALTWIVRGEIMLYARNKQPEYCFDKAVAAGRTGLFRRNGHRRSLYLCRKISDSIQIP